MPKKVRGITGNSQRKKRAEGLRRLRAKESEEERNRRRRRDAERHILARILETPEQAIQRKARDAERHRQKRALETQKRVEETKLNQAKIKETQDVTVRVKLGKSSPHNCSQKQRNHASELPRLSEALMKHICYNPQN
ncbi:uncharacterized protein C05D11.13-like [Uloborus diversus]|uniref:uncharacterized protein C05D11.13-like n=1 Tax=Uloborus diversus TaxID=327109 RepID=UPI0024093B5F|nr:uncharacterized protein C05D11.13-like [Uloborus diversus]